MFIRLFDGAYEDEHFVNPVETMARSSSAARPFKACLPAGEASTAFRLPDHLPGKHEVLRLNFHCQLHERGNL